MSIDWNEIIKDAESALAKIITQRVVAGIISRVSFLSGFLAGPLGFVVGIIVGQIVKYGDLVAYHFGDDWMNSSHGQELQKTGEALAALPATATQEEIDAAKLAKANAIDALMGA